MLRLCAMAALCAAAAPQQQPPPEQQPYRVRFHLQLEAAGAVEDASFTLTVHPAWAPLGAAQFAELLASGFFDGARFFRVVPDFVVQWGLPAAPATAALWEDRTIPDDPVSQSNTRGFVSFATSGADTRTTQLFVNTKVAGNAQLDGMGFSPFGEIDAAGMAIVDRIYAADGERPDQGRIGAEGNAYLAREFPSLSWIRSVERCRDRGCTVEGRVRHSGVLRAGSPFDFPPFSAWDGSVPVGLEVDLALALARDLGGGVSVAWVQSSWGGLLQDLLDDRFDLAIGGISMIEERVRAVNFSRPLLDDGKVLVYRCGESERFEALAELLQVAVGEDGGLDGGEVVAATAAWRQRYVPRVAVNPGGTNERAVKAWFALDPSWFALEPSNAVLVMVERNGDQFGAIARGLADVTVTDRTEAMYRTAPAHQEQGAAGANALCAGTDLIGPVSQKALLLPAAKGSNMGTTLDRAAAIRDDGSWVRRVNRFLDAAFASGDYQRWEEKALSSPSPRGRDRDGLPAPAATAEDKPGKDNEESSSGLVALVALGMVVVGVLLALRSGGGEVIFCCCIKRSGGKYAGLPVTDGTSAKEFSD